MKLEIDVNSYSNKHVIETHAVQSKSRKKPEVDSKIQVFKNQQIETDSEEKVIPLKSALKKKKVQWKEHQSIRMHKGKNWMQTSVAPTETVRKIAEDYLVGEEKVIKKDKKHSHHDAPKHGSNYLTLEQIADLGQCLPKMNQMQLKQVYRSLYTKAWATYQLNDREVFNFVDQHLCKCLSRANNNTLKEIHSYWHENVLAADQSVDQKSWKFANHYFQQAANEINFRVDQAAIQSRAVYSRHR